MKPRKKHDELMAETPAGKQPPTASEMAEPLSREERIRQRAYELYLQRGDGGDALSDWFQAEAEILAALGTPEQDNAEMQKTANRRRRTAAAESTTQAAAGGKEEKKSPRATRTTTSKRQPANR
ncbi:MAG TPA: DUF2934 domain-containing protein [Blastocatellia bacterium]|nr:DUF2934 domain-containing protein [Blastocatellia bacterium]